jgi:hypothetical protein
MRRTATLGLLLTLLVPAGASGQRVEELDLPRSVAEEVVDFFNRPSTLRLQGRVDVPAGRTIVGDVAVLGGPVEFAGEVDGSLVVINGDLSVAPGARIRGDLTVLGGRAEVPRGTVDGRVAVYDEALRYATREDGITIDEPRREDRGFELEGRRSRTRFSVRVEESYNRVEGLPVLFGPVFETRGRRGTRLDALGIWRTDRGLQLDDDEMGWYLRAEQRLGSRVTVGGTAHSVVAPVERWRLRDVEASLATFLFHRDYRDHYGLEGFSAFLRWEDAFTGLRLSVEYRDEEHAYVPVGSPWSLTRNDEPWRPQPLVGEGRLHSVEAEVRFDDRNDPEDPSDGWYAELSARLGVGGGLTLPGFRQGEPLPPTEVSAARPLGSAFRSGFVDVRRYARVSPVAQLRVRGLLAGSLDGSPLPPQFQHALGGEGSLPGYALFRGDCGARATTSSVFRAAGGASERTPAFADYGCDRVALLQLEYLHDLSLGLDLGPDDDTWGEEWDWYPAVDFSPRLALFLDVGRGWALGDEGRIPTRTDTGTLMDAGVAVYLGDLGLHWAWPLRDGGGGVNFYLRIDHRF